MKNFTTSALFDSNPVITWDETSAERKKDLNDVMSQIMKGEEPDYDRLEVICNYLFINESKKI